MFEIKIVRVHLTCDGFVSFIYLGIFTNTLRYNWNPTGGPICDSLTRAGVLVYTGDLEGLYIGGQRRIVEGGIYLVRRNYGGE